MKLLVLSTIFLAVAASSGCTTAQRQNIDAPPVVTQVGISELSPEQARPAVEAAYSQFIDVRTPEEYNEGHAYRAVNIPLATLQQNFDRLEKDEPLFVICRTDNRSREAAKILADAGFRQVVVITGGTNQWQAAGMPMANEPRLNAGELDEQTASALIEALNDERRSHALYTAMADKFGRTPPFANIVKAEKRHEARLLPLFEKYKVPSPQNAFDAAKMPVPATRLEACKVGVESEEKNIDMYEGFLKFVKEQDVIDAFRYLQAASRDNHLPAFTRCSQGGGMGRGPGGGPGRLF